jgi:2,4-dienoyl-CoA reductase-like NADH-dependent reductase (Old Yellow Enzyme family)/thioredoxin reductase
MIKLKNPFIFAPVKTGYGDQSGNINERHLKFYEERAKYLGAVTPEPLYIDKGLRELPMQIGIASDEQLPGLKKLTDMLHTFDTKAIAHLNHPGRMANPMIPGNYFLSSTGRACEAGGATPRPMDKEEMQQAIALFVSAAKRAEQAGFDVIELQMGHGYLLAQFISPFVNDRTDEYGGAFENRIRFPMEVLDAVQAAVNLPLMVRISGDEMIPQGFHMEEMIALAKILKEKGVDAVHVSAGTVCNTPPWYFQHMFVPKGKTWEMAAKIKQETGLPTVFVGQINEAQDVDKLLNEMEADFVAVGRALVADPDFAGKYLGEKDELIRPCLSCSDGCLGGVKSGKGIGCLVNPLVNYDGALPQKATVAKHIAVVGGGLAGSEAALNLARKGHKVSLFEKDKLGGQFELAALPPKKQSLHKIVEYYEKALAREGVLLVRHEAAKEELEQFDEVVMATGSMPVIPYIKGLTKFHWAEILEEVNMPENRSVAVVGGGLIGTEVAHKLLQRGNKVYLIELMDEIARGMEMIERKMTLKSFEQADIAIHTQTKLLEVQDKVLLCEKEGAPLKIEGVDEIVLATGMKPYHPFEEGDLSVPMHFIGDAKEVGKAQNAIRDGFLVALEI